MDRNQTIGMILISVLFVAYMFTQSDKNQEGEKQQTQVVDSSRIVNLLPVDNAKTVDTSKSDTKDFEEETIKITNEVFELLFSNNGGRLIAVKLLKHHDHNNNLIELFTKESAQFNLKLKTNSGLKNVFSGGFITKNTSKEIKGNETLDISFTQVDGDKSISHLYTITGDSYLINYNLEASGFGKEIISDDIELTFSDNLKAFEKALSVSRQKSTISYLTTEEDFNDIGAGSEDEELEEKLKWLTFKQRFFNTSIIPNQNLTNVKLKADLSDDDPKPNDVYLDKLLSAKADLAISDRSNINESISFYFGPNDYRLMKDLAKEKNIIDFEKNVDLGWKVFSIINKWLVIPLFRFLENYISSYGVIILILVFVIKLILFPIAYKSYLSMAKMKELKPEIDEIKERLGDDQVGVQQESMKLYQQVGASPLQGCIPMVLQMPIFLALFNFFPNFIELRHQSFLWANDLSSYDDLLSWSGFPIPGIGNHISLFTVLMTLSTLAYTYYNNQINSAAQQGPMKYMGYLMPVMFFFFLNDFAAGLTWYYFVSNLITITQQNVASRFIDKDKIRTQMEENKKKFDKESKSGKKSGFRQRLEEAQKMRAAQAKAKKK